MMRGALGKVLQADMKARGGQPFLRAKVGSGLARPDHFNWIRETQRLYSTGRFSSAIVMLGGNDTQNIEHGGRVHRFASTSWNQIYKGRALELAAIMCPKTDGPILWLGSPKMRPRGYDRQIAHVNGLIEKIFAGSRCIRFVPTKGILGGHTYRSHMAIQGRWRQIRMSDGIHLTRSGGHLVANFLMPFLKRTKPELVAGRSLPRKAPETVLRSASDEGSRR